MGLSAHRAGERWIVIVRAVVSVGLLLILPLSLMAEDKADVLRRGLWLLHRKDAANTARADIAGNMRIAPREVWHIGPHRRPVQQAWRLGSDYLALSGSALERLRPNGDRVWIVTDAGVSSLIGIMDFGEAGSAALAAVGGSNLVLFDLADGRRCWRWAPPPKAELGGPILWQDNGRYRLAIFPQNSVVATCYEFTAPAVPPTQLWSQDYTGKYWPNFGPFGVVADMNNNHRPDIVLAGKPAYVAAIDGDSGQILFDLKYSIPDAENEGRPYGLIQATDLDGDGFRDVVVASCQVEEYVGVIRNMSGSGFELAWSTFVENDLPNDDRELRPQTSSIIDLNGDGQKEFVLGLFNVVGESDKSEGEWRTVVFDPFKGWDSRTLDLKDRYFWGCYDLNDDGRPELITSTEHNRRTSTSTTLQAVDGVTGRDIAELQNTSLVTPNRRLPNDVAFHAIRATPVFVESEAGNGLLVNIANGEKLWRIDDSQSVLTPFSVSPMARLVHFGSQDRVLKDAQLQVGSPGTTAPLAYHPLVSFADGRPELIIARSDGSIEGGQPDFGKPGLLKNVWSVKGCCPAVWIGADGERLVAAFDDASDRFFLYQPRAGELNANPRVTVDLPFMPARTPGMLLPFGERELRVYVGMKTGVHTIAGALYDRNGNLIWRDDQEGPYPRPAAVVPFAGETQLVVDNHGKILFYSANGSKNLIAHGWNNTVPGRGDGAKYVLPIVGPFGAGGAPRIVLSSGLENLEILDMNGDRLAMIPYGSIYERQYSASAVLQRPDGDWSLGVLTTLGAFHCTDLLAGKDRWIMNLGGNATHPTRVVSGDVDGDGTEDFLVGLADGTLAAITESDGNGAIVWSYRFDASIRDILIADVNGDALAEVVVETDDGKVRILTSQDAK
ncbi:MAG: VCBS repeat-containing protein [Planctomycetales bacterium]|nr:VCBS repeat-containing protein [Planctomycetales bacterium]